MLRLLWLIPALPFAGFLVLTLLGVRLSRSAVARVGVGSVALSALATLVVGASFVLAPPPEGFWVQSLWTWLRVGDFTPVMAFYLDPLSLIMGLVVTVVGFLIHLYSAEHMRGEEGYARFFASMNLFVAAMLILVLADDLLLLYLGWEGVGLCSYLLIGFWYQDAANGAAARKAFIVTRVGDAAMAIGLLLLLTTFGTLAVQPLMQKAQETWQAGAPGATVAAILLLAGALGKSAQLPLQTWLPDAMAGPTPVSALIHAATMVTAGVYLIARTHVLFALAPAVQHAVAVIGAATLLLAGCSALTQRDIKRVLAYSTISQIGYMFLALGVGAWSAAIFHLMTHAFFKALLFLGAGVVIQALHDEHDMYRMGGLRRELPLTFWTFLIASGSLAAVPVVTAGFYSKDLILWDAWSSAQGSAWLWGAGLLGAFLTSLYTFRMVFLTFFGEAKSRVRRRPGVRVKLPLLALAVLSVIGGWVELPEVVGHQRLFSTFLGSALPATHLVVTSAATERGLQIIAGVVSLTGILLAYVGFLRRPVLAARLAATPWGRGLQGLWLAGWGFDRLYEMVLIRPWAGLAQANHSDGLDVPYRGVARLVQRWHEALRRTETGRVRWYAMGVTGGAVLVIAMVVFL